MVTLAKFSTIVSHCKNSIIGKHLPDALYVHADALSDLDPVLKEYESRARNLVNNLDRATIVKFGTERPKIFFF